MRQRGLAVSFFQKRIVQIGFVFLLFVSGVVAGAFSDRFLPSDVQKTIYGYLESFFTGIGQVGFRDLFLQLLASGAQQLLLAALFTLTLTGVLLLPVFVVFTGFLYGMVLHIILGLFGASGAVFNVLYFFPRLLILIPFLLIFYSQCFMLCMNMTARIINRNNKTEMNLRRGFLISGILLLLCIVSLMLCSALEASLAPYLVINIFK